MTAPIDLRSDTVTRPTEAMRRAMAAAEVGDDWFGDDPTVNRLQDRAAEVTGMDAALYLPSGTMCTQIALHALARSGNLVVCEESAHVCGMEAAAAAALSGVTFRTIAADRGLLTPGQVAAALAPDPYDVTVVDLVAIENTHQVGGGSVYQVDEVRAMFCLSKGLGAPIGSMLCGSAEFIRSARRIKVLFGAAWRQAGIMAAAGLIALDEGPKRLHEDHENARVLAEGVADLLPGAVDPAAAPTNIVFVDVAGTGRSAPEWADRLRAEGLLVTMVSGKVRMLTHRDVGPADIAAALAAWRRAAAA
jgi:threonine aldolase